MGAQIDAHLKPKICQNVGAQKAGQATTQQVPVGVSAGPCAVVQPNKIMFEDLPLSSNSTSKNAVSLGNFQAQIEQRKADEEKIKVASETINQAAQNQQAMAAQAKQVLEPKQQTGALNSKGDPHKYQHDKQQIPQLDRFFYQKMQGIDNHPALHDPGSLDQDDIIFREVKSKFFVVQNLPVEVTKDELRKFFEYRNVRISAIEICHYQLYDEPERVYALVEIRDMDKSRDFYQMFNNSTFPYQPNNSHGGSAQQPQMHHVNIKLQLIIPNINEGGSLDEYNQILLTTGQQNFQGNKHSMDRHREMSSDSNKSDESKHQIRRNNSYHMNWGHPINKAGSWYSSNQGYGESYLGAKIDAGGGGNAGEKTGQLTIDQYLLDCRNTLFTSLILIGVPSLISESELFYMLSDKIYENNDDEDQQQPKPVKIIMFDKNDVENNGIALVHYSSFNQALEAKKLLNQHNPQLNRFFGPDFEGAILAEPPISELIYKTTFNYESYIIKLSKVPILGGQMVDSQKPLCESIVHEMDRQLLSFFHNQLKQELMCSQFD